MQGEYECGDLSSQLAFYIAEMKLIVLRSKNATSSEATNEPLLSSPQTAPTVLHTDNNEYRPLPLRVRSRSAPSTYIGPRARLKGMKTPSPKKRPIETCDSPNCDSPYRFAHWESPAKSTRNLQAKMEAEEIPLAITEAQASQQYDQDPIIIDEDNPSHESQKSSPEKFSRGHSPSPDRKRPITATQRVGLGSYSPFSPSFYSPSAQVPQPLSSVDKTNIHETLAKINNKFKAIIQKERQQISDLLKHSQALLPHNINLNQDLLHQLSLSCLQQMNKLVDESLSELQSLGGEIRLLEFPSADQNLQSIYEELSNSIAEAILEDSKHKEAIKKSYTQYYRDTTTLIQYFTCTKDQSNALKILYTLTAESPVIYEGYLESNPTLVRRLIQESLKFISNAPENNTLLVAVGTIIPRLKNYLVSMSVEYAVEKTELEQAPKCVF